MAVFQPEELPISPYKTEKELSEQFTQRPQILPLTRRLQQQEVPIIYQESNNNVLPLVVVVGLFSFFGFLAFLAFLKR